MPMQVTVRRYVYENDSEHHAYYEVHAENAVFYASGDVNVIDGEYEVGGGCVADRADDDFLLPMDLCLGQLAMFERGLREQLIEDEDLFEDDGGQFTALKISEEHVGHVLVQGLWSKPTGQDYEGLDDDDIRVLVITEMREQQVKELKDYHPVTDYFNGLKAGDRVILANVDGREVDASPKEWTADVEVLGLVCRYCGNWEHDEEDCWIHS